MAAELGPSTRADIQPLYRSKELTIIHFVWAPCMSLMPHRHRTYPVVGIHDGPEDNLFWRRKVDTIEAFSAESLGPRDVVVLDTIHSVLYPIGEMTARCTSMAPVSSPWNSLAASGTTKRWSKRRGMWRR